MHSLANSICVQVYEVNSRGLKIFSKSWLPESSPLKAIICYCHGYADTCTFYFEGMKISMLNEKFVLFVYAEKR